MDRLKTLLKGVVFSRQFLSYASIAVLTFLLVQYVAPHFSQIAPIIMAIEIGLIVAITWGMAVHTVMKSLFGIGAGFSLVIFLAQSYCDAKINDHTGDDALRSLVVFSLIYMGVQFFLSLYKDASAKSKKLKEIDGKGNPRFISLPYALFTGLFTWQIIQVLTPILSSLCVYQ